MSRLASTLMACLLASCGTEVCFDDRPGAGDPNGYCEADADCDESDFCLAEWCDAECRPWERCVPKRLAGDWCDSDRMCADGLACAPSDEYEAGECSASL